MSLTVSRGLSDAGRWTAVATTVVEHLEAVEQATKRHRQPPPAPVGVHGQLIARAVSFLLTLGHSFR